MRKGAGDMNQKGRRKRPDRLPLQAAI